MRARSESTRAKLSEIGNRCLSLSPRNNVKSGSQQVLLEHPSHSRRTKAVSFARSDRGQSQWSHICSKRQGAHLHTRSAPCTPSLAVCAMSCHRIGLRTLDLIGSVSEGPRFQERVRPPKRGMPRVEERKKRWHCLGVFRWALGAMSKKAQTSAPRIPPVATRRGRAERVWSLSFARSRLTCEQNAKAHTHTSTRAPLSARRARRPVQRHAIAPVTGVCTCEVSGHRPGRFQRNLRKPEKRPEANSRHGVPKELPRMLPEGAG